MKLTPERFAEVFPGAFVIRRIERGAHHERRWGWVATFSNNYFTSDSDRIVGIDHGTVESYPFGWAATIEEALGALAEHQLHEAEAAARSLVKSQRGAEETLADLRAKLTA